MRIAVITEVVGGTRRHLLQCNLSGPGFGMVTLGNESRGTIWTTWDRDR